MQHAVTACSIQQGLARPCTMQPTKLLSEQLSAPFWGRSTLTLSYARYWLLLSAAEQARNCEPGCMCMPMCMSVHMWVWRVRACVHMYLQESTWIPLFPLFFKFAFSRLFWQKKKWLTHWYIVMSSWRTWNYCGATFPGNGCASLKRDGCPLHSRASWSHVPAVVRWVHL